MKILGSIEIESKQHQKVKVVFVRHRYKRDWLAILSTRVDWPAKEIVHIYGKSWDIEVFFKMLQQNLNLEKEAQLRDYDDIVAHTTIAMVRHIFLAFEQRCHDAPNLLVVCSLPASDKIKHISLLEALQQLLAVVLDKVRSSGEFAKNVIIILINTGMKVAINFIETSKRVLQNKHAWSTD